MSVDGLSERASGTTCQPQRRWRNICPLSSCWHLNGAVAQALAAFFATPARVPLARRAERNAGMARILAEQRAT
jgi:hypothetical protein